MNEGKLAVMFPGQGKLQPGMGEEAFRNSAEARAVFEEASIVAKADMAQVCFGDRTDELPKHPQMSLAAASLADYEYKIERELPYADLYMGMSAGEMAALAAAGAFESRQSFFTAVLAREEAMVKAGETHPGRMVAVRGITKEQGKRLAQKVKASYAGRVALDHINISGDLHIHERIEQALDWLKETEIIKRIVTIPLPETVPPAHGDLQPD